MKKVCVSLIVLVVCVSCSAQDIELPSPNKTGGMPLMEALDNRQSSREFSDKALEPQVLSDLLWAAYGFNRDKMRTAPSANNRQEFSIYVALESGVYVYDAEANVLKIKVKGDLRGKTGSQDFVATAPLNLVYVANLDKNSPEGAGVNCGFISQNVYLYCASAGLGTVVRGWFDRDVIKEAFGLTDQEAPILTQTVGYKK
jgi:Nitroreductase